MSIKPMLILAVAAFTLSAMAEEPLSSLFEAYHQLQTALAGDDFTAAQAATKRLHHAADKVQADRLPAEIKATWNGQAKHLKMALKNAGQAGGIDALRQQFEHISMAVISLSKTVGPDGFREYRCPMAFNNKGANWLQKGETTANPYFGSAMLRCGAPVKAEEEHHHHH